jgi:prolipoprotein diacylglyceryltransferase
MTDLLTHVPWIQAVACFVVLGLAVRQAERQGLNELMAFAAGVAGLIGAYFGGHVLVVLSDPAALRADPSLLWRVSGSAKAAFGAFAGAAAGGSLLLWLFGAPVRRYADASVPAIVLGYAIYRVGCWTHGCEVGTATDLPWAASYAGAASVHPIGFYHIVLAMGILAALWKKPFGSGQGQQVTLALAIYASVRFFLEMLRAEPTWVASLTLGQASCLVALAVAAVMAARIRLSEGTSVPDSSSASSRPATSA